MSRLFLTACAVSGFLATLMGAVGAHLWRGRMDEHMAAVFQTAVQYHFWHTLVLGMIALLARQYADSRWLRWSGIAMVAGMALFSGSLYWLAAGGEPLYAKLAPLGGMSLMVAWLLLAAFAATAI
ncbi:DUF423 domain-containing protein [Methylogaea oryzae]|uniref:Membrane protein n=1 Tax=Methylogaea oryzae TaxID=1295382 RepID=A0A8D5AI98_9GAMM|nr:DUF423 domain-containing protein [Methylogaea oryzae]BBL69509.1 membrane protein [Methylogaea oryzae]